VKELKTTASRKPHIILIALCAVAFVWHLYRFYVGFLDPAVTDVATTTLAAGNLMLQRVSPYSVPIDKVAYEQTGPAYGGYKYLPIMAMVYVPLGQALSVPGIILTNLLLDCGVLIATYMLAYRIGGTTAGLYSAFLYLVTPFVPPEIYGSGVNDLAAVLPLLAAFILVDKKKTLAGLCVGLSVAMKLFPGLIIALCCLPRNDRFGYIGGVAIGMLPIVPYMIVSPTDLFTNIILYPLVRPVDSLSWSFSLPPEYRFVGIAIYVIAVLCLGAVVLFKHISPHRRCGLAVIGIVLAILTGPGAHRNYDLWWLPFFAILVGANLTRAYGLRFGKSLPNFENVRS
jgi:uncharacterized membrane protein